MGDPTLADVLAKLDELQRAVASLHAAVVGGRGAPSAPPVSPGSGQGERAPVDEEAARPAPAAVAPEDESVVADRGAPDLPAEDESEDAEPPVPRPSDGPEVAIRLLFSAALREHEEESWPYLMALTHSRDLENPRALDYLKAFNWRKLRRSVDRYLVDRDPTSFHVVRMDPAELGDAEYVKVFLHQQGGMPGPVHLRRDSKKGGAWLVAQISL